MRVKNFLKSIITLLAMPVLFVSIVVFFIVCWPGLIFVILFRLLRMDILFGVEDLIETNEFLLAQAIIILLSASWLFLVF